MAKYLRLHGDIGEGECSAAAFVAALDAVPKSQAIYVSINSRGGDYFDGVAIHNAIAQRGGVTVIVDGLAASAASYIAMAAKRIVMSPGTHLMIHSPMANASGNPAQIELTLSTLRKLEREMAEVYSRRSSMSVEEALILMRAESWIDAETAHQIFRGVELDRGKVAASINPEWLHGFRNVPLALAVAGRVAEKAPPAKVDPVQVKLDRERLKLRRKRLALMRLARTPDPETAARQLKRRRLELRLEASNLRTRGEADRAREANERDLAEREAAKTAKATAYAANWLNVPRRTW